MPKKVAGGDFGCIGLIGIELAVILLARDGQTYMIIHTTFGRFFRKIDFPQNKPLNKSAWIVRKFLLTLV
jgi:hypothetical protein